VIRRLSSSLQTFKTLEFQAGLNVLLAEKTPDASDTQTRNGAGKSSFVELVHFILGSNLERGHFLRNVEFESARFSLQFDLGDDPVTAERTPGEDEILIAADDVSSWCRQPKPNAKTGRSSLGLKPWKAVLGNRMFGLPDPEEDDDAPSFRAVFPYFARRQGEGGFVAPEQTAQTQQLGDRQTAITFLLGLDASIPRELQRVRKRESGLRIFSKAAKEGTFGDIIERSADLRTKIAVLEAQTEKLRNQLSAFQIVPQYREMEVEASRLGQEISELSNDNTIDRMLFDQLQEAVRSESPPQFANVKKAYDEALLTLPELVTRRFSEVEAFHRSVIENRFSHLRAETDATQRRIEARDRRKLTLDERRSQIMRQLQSGGALEQFSVLQVELTRAEAKTEALRTQFGASEALERNKADLNVSRANLHRRLQDDHHEQGEAIDAAIKIFEGLSNAMYERAGSLTVHSGPNGPEFLVKIEGQRSKGINSMQIFCFDMMLMELCVRRRHSPGFLIHDSHLFDGVDERQIARALEIGAERAESLGFQYVVTLNEDAVPRAVFREKFNFQTYVNRQRLTDARGDGGLFGFRFR
jgi:uncharacterized protein YydD (DUF2326 family)